MDDKSNVNELPSTKGLQPHPVVSVIIPVFNGARTICACLDSLLELSPRSPTHEIIVVNNRSTDNTAQLVGRYPNVALTNEERRGPAAARNKGLDMARGVYVAFIDSDCIVTPEWMIEAMDAFSDSGVLGVAGAIVGTTPANDIQDWLNVRGTLDPQRALAHPFLPYIQTANAIFRRETLLTVGGFTETISVAGGEDCDLSWRILTKLDGRFSYAPEALVYHDHRTTLRGVFRQSAAAARGSVCLAQIWGGSLPKRSWKTSAWEYSNLLYRAYAWVKSVLTGQPSKARLWALLDFVQAAGMRWGRLSGMFDAIRGNL